MKRFLLLSIGIFFLATLSACKGVESCPAADQVPEMEMSASGDEVSDNIISSDMLSVSMYNALEVEWAAWNAKDEMQKLVSSHLPGNIYKPFDTWAECEEFLGFELWNPLEDSEFEKGSYVGMPVGANDASRFYISVYGTGEGEVQWIFVDSGYLDGDIRITVNAHIYPDKPLELDGEQMITEDSGENYVAASKTMVIGPVSYNIRVVGEENQRAAVKATLEKVLPYFEDVKEAE